MLEDEVLGALGVVGEEGEAVWEAHEEEVEVASEVGEGSLYSTV